VRRELGQAIERLDRHAPLTIAMILIVGGLAKAGRAELGISLIGGYCFLLCAATQLWARLRTRAKSGPLRRRIEVSECVIKSICK
jgi:hypothetical protein